MIQQILAVYCPSRRDKNKIWSKFFYYLIRDRERCHVLYFCCYRLMRYSTFCKHSIENQLWVQIVRSLKLVTYNETQMTQHLCTCFRWCSRRKTSTVCCIQHTTARCTYLLHILRRQTYTFYVHSIPFFGEVRARCEAVCWSYYLLVTLIDRIFNLTLCPRLVYCDMVRNIIS